MAVKFDKEALAKHYFWLVSAGFLLLFMVLVALEAMYEPGVKEKTEYEGALKSVQGLSSGFKNEKFLPKWEERFKEYEKDKNGAWEKAWAPQSTIYDWPDAIREREALRSNAGQPVFPIYPNYNQVDAPIPNIIYPSMEFSDDERRTYKDAWYSEGFDRAWEFMTSAWKNPEAVSYSREVLDSKGEKKSAFVTYARFRKDGDGDVLQPNLPFKLAVPGSAIAGGGGGGAASGDAMIPGGGAGKAGGGMSMPPGAGSAPGPATSAAAGPSGNQAKDAFMAAMRQFTSWQVNPSKEEIWLLQEDYWIRRELINLLRESVASIATFHKVESREVAPAGADGRIKMANAFWELDLILENGGRQISKRSRIKNVHLQQRPQPLADPRTGIQVEFAFFQNGFRRVARVKLDGEVLPFGKDAAFAKDFPTDGIDFTKPFDLVQVFTPGTSPIRLVEGLELPFNSHRTATNKLVARKTLKKQGNTGGGGTGDGAAPAGGEGAAGDPGAGMAAMAAMMGGPKGGPGGGAKTGDLTPYNKLDRARYVISTETCRHMPFAMKLTLDQSTLPTVITALSNSKLRVQVTQVQYQYIPFGASQSIGGGPGMGMPGMGMPGAGMPGMPGMGRPGMGMPGMGGGPGPGMPGSPGGPGGGRMGLPGGDTGGEGGQAMGGPSAPGASGSGSALADGNLVDVALYGIAVLYERFPEDPKAKTAAVAAAPAP